MLKQQQRIFFGPTDPWGANEPTPEEKRKLVDRTSPESPFSRFVGNEKAVVKMQTAAYSALGQFNHKQRELAFAIFGPSSSGKTTIARLYAETVQLPFVEISPKAIASVDDLFKEISRILEKEGLPLVEVIERNHYILPPTVVFIDEIHALMDSVVQGLLKATEYNDALMVTESGKTINTYNVTWMIATTDEGKLFDAFRTRFSPIVLKYLNKSDVARIVKLANPDLSEEICRIIAHYNSRIPRKALEFARYMRMYADMTGSEFEEVAKYVASLEDIDEYGMQAVHLKVLRALGHGPVARNRISNVTGTKIEEAEKFILPWLLTETEDQPALIKVTAKGYTITEAGLLELEKRGINHLGQKAMAA